MNELLNPYYGLDAALVFWAAVAVSFLAQRK
jgi:hypothetical protein